MPNKKDFYEEEQEVDTQTQNSDDESLTEEEEAELVADLAQKITRKEYLKNPEAYYGKKVVVVDSQYDFAKPEGFSEIVEERFGWREKLTEETRAELEARAPAHLPVKSGNLKVENIKEQKVTEAMAMDALDYRVPRSPLSVKKIYDDMRAHRDGLISYLLGRGDPQSAFTCFLDQKAKKKGIIVLDEKKAQSLINSLSDEKLLQRAKERFGSMPAREDYFSSHVCLMYNIDKNSLGENFTPMDVYEKIPSKFPNPDEDDKKYLCAELHAMKEQHAARSFWYMIAHPINYYREAKRISGAEFILSNCYKITPEQAERFAVEHGDANEPEVKVSASDNDNFLAKVKGDLVKEAQAEREIVFDDTTEITLPDPEDEPEDELEETFEETI